MYIFTEPEHIYEYVLEYFGCCFCLRFYLFLFVFVVFFSRSSLVYFHPFHSFHLCIVICKHADLHAILERVRHAQCSIRCSMCASVFWMRVIFMWTGTSSKTNQCLVTDIMKKCNKWNEKRRTEERNNMNKKSRPSHVHYVLKW